MPTCANCGASLPEPAPPDDAASYCRLCQKDRYDASLNTGLATGIIAGLVLAVIAGIALNATPAGDLPFSSSLCRFSCPWPPSCTSWATPRPVFCSG